MGQQIWILPQSNATTTEEYFFESYPEFYQELDFISSYLDFFDGVQQELNTPVVRCFCPFAVLRLSLTDQPTLSNSGVSAREAFIS